jgi:hypothetical protein
MLRRRTHNTEQSIGTKSWKDQPMQKMKKRKTRITRVFTIQFGSFPPTQKEQPAPSSLSKSEVAGPIVLDWKGFVMLVFFVWGRGMWAGVVWRRTVVPVTVMDTLVCGMTLVCGTILRLA